MRPLYILTLTTMLLFVWTGCEEKKEVTITVNDQNKTDDGVRPASEGMMSAAYFTLVNDHADQDTLIGAESTVAGEVQIHESYINEEGLSSMKEVGPIPVSRGDSVRFERGGLHIMLLDLKQDLKPGDKVAIDLIYSSGSRHTTSLTVFRDQ